MTKMPPINMNKQRSHLSKSAKLI